MDEKNNVTKSHKVLLANRKNGAFSGVVDVLSFDVAEILQRQFFSESRFWWGWDYSCCTIFFVFSEESCHMAQSGLEWKTSVIGYYALLRFF